MLEFFKAPFLVLHFSYYTLMTYLTMLSVTLLSMLMILLSILKVIRHLICANNLNWLLNLNLIKVTLWTGVRSGLLISMAGKFGWFCLTGLILLMWKWMGLFLRKNHLLKSWGWPSLMTSGELLLVFSTNVNLLYLFYWTTQRCCLLHLIKQNCLLKIFLWTLILMT